MDDKKPYLVAGPCSIESREQLARSFATLSAIPQVAMIRCGVWKPRTRPGGFEGRGEEALLWLQEIRSAAGNRRRDIPCCCEVARPAHVELALRYGMEAVWIGARTTANPFMVQELTEALRGSVVSVLVKNAPTPDVHLWIGAIERCRQVGINHIMAVHRGFDQLPKGYYRNSPLWEVPIELRRAMPEIPLLCDPSHIAGKRDPLLSLSQTALDLGFDGLMLEVHPNPVEALTDSRQQITPQELTQLIEHLVLRCTDNVSADEELRLLREEIDDIDHQTLQLLAARQAVARKIAHIKAKGNWTVLQPKRWDTLLHQRMASAHELGMDEDFVRGIYERIHTESIRIQEEEISTLNIQ